MKKPVHSPHKKCAAGAAHIHEPRITNHEISILTIPGLAVVRLTHEYRNRHKP